jgi:hypothetical protein
VFLDPCGGNHIALRERFCSVECAKNFKWDIYKGKEMLAQLNGLATHQDIEYAVAAALYAKGVLDA